MGRETFCKCLKTEWSYNILNYNSNAFFHTGEKMSVLAMDCNIDDFGFFYLDDHSSCSFREPSGTSVTLWQVFTVSLPVGYECNETSASPVLNVSALWARGVLDLDLTNHSQSLTSTTEGMETGCKVATNVSLTLYDIMNTPDTDPDYSVTLTVEDCPDLSPVKAGDFILTVYPSCENNAPLPTHTQLEYTFVEGSRCPINATFIGGQTFLDAFVWKDSEGERVCFTAGETKTSGRFMCGWIKNDENTCNNTAWLLISNCSRSDAGNYSVGDKDSVPTHVLLCKLL
jgi:hypothetical protein